MRILLPTYLKIAIGLGLCVGSYFLGRHIGYEMAMRDIKRVHDYIVRAAPIQVPMYLGPSCPLDVKGNCIDTPANTPMSPISLQAGDLSIPDDWTVNCVLIDSSKKTITPNYGDAHCTPKVRP